MAQKPPIVKLCVLTIGGFSFVIQMVVTGGPKVDIL